MFRTIASMSSVVGLTNLDFVYDIYTIYGRNGSHRDLTFIGCITKDLKDHLNGYGLYDSSLVIVEIDTVADPFEPMITPVEGSENEVLIRSYL